ncbi:uncharacterized protein LOC123272221 [Cotesia glomerata]|uniref:uncharacterized protein LOC123272221 n=1 Tax=Cotesia glomerata TaxID=32391 RepID=UPI001D0078C6|nr:uncharacterized protein LOC123272221 [Cotesia glomerata]
MGDSELAERFNPNSKMFIATTNVILPAGLDATDMLIVVLIHRNHAFGISWAFLPDKSETSFNAAVEIICSQIAPEVNPNTIYYDYEQRLNDSLTANVPGANLKGTFLAYADIVIGRAIELNVNFADENILIIFKRLLAISLLPAANIPEGFLWLKANIPEVYVPAFEELFQYYQQSWINSMGPENFSFYNDFDSFNDSMKNHIQNLTNFLGNNSSIWNCLRVLLNQRIRSHSDFQSLNNNGRITCTPRCRSLVSTRKLRRLWELFSAECMDYHLFFATASGILTPFVNDAIHNGVRIINDLRLYQENNVEVNVDLPNQNRGAHYVGQLVFEELVVDDVRFLNHRIPRVGIVANVLIDNNEDGNDVNQEANAEVADNAHNDHIRQEAANDGGDNPQNAEAAHVDEDDNDEIQLIIPNNGPVENAGVAVGIVPDDRAFDAVDQLCIICADQPVNQYFLPCRHQIACYGCVESWRAVSVESETDFICPVCRQLTNEVAIVTAAAAA